MAIGGIQKTSLIDYPEGLSTVLFFRGCNFNCSYCHNAELIPLEGDTLDTEKTLQELSARSHLIDAVVFSGGECTEAQELYDMVSKVRKIGYRIKIDTNGSNPEVLEKLMVDGLIDFISMDVKAPPELYEKVAGVPVDLKAIEKSIALIQRHMKHYEFRTTVCRELLDREDIIQIAYQLKGSRQYAIQNFKDTSRVFAGKGRFTPYAREELISIRDEIKQWFEEIVIRT